MVDILVILYLGYLSLDVDGGIIQRVIQSNIWEELRICYGGVGIYSAKAV